MIAKLKTILTGDLVDIGYFIYIISDGNGILYIGKTTRDVTTRLNEHCWPVPDWLGQAILDNAPSSDDWPVELLTLEECEEIATKALHVPYIHDPDRAVHWAEVFLIKQKAPLLNCIYNR